MAKLDFNPNLPLEKIEVSRFNVRHTKVRERLEELAKSIAEIGVKQPVVVFEKKDEKGKYELIIGQRRYLACKEILKWETIPALITRVKDKTEAAIFSFCENIHRLDLSYEDKMQVATELLAKLRSVKDVADAIGVSPQTVKNYLGYSAVPEPIKEMVGSGKLAASTALLIAKNIPDENKAVRIAEKIKEQRSSKKRRLILTIAKENPDKSDKEIIKLANKKYDKVTIDLTPNLSQRLERACQDYRVERENIVAEALEEWLRSRGFY